MPRTSSAGVRAAIVVLAALIALSVPGILIVNGFRLLATDTFVEWEIGRGSFPPDPFGLDTAQRIALARIGLESIQPGGEGIVLLERATLPDGAPAFHERELTHMRDVRTLFGAALRLQLIGGILIVALALVLARTRLRTAVPAGLLAGSLGTLAIAALLVPVILFGFDGFFTRFHEVFFSGDSWVFSDEDTLIRIYPERFWTDVSRITAAVAVGQALLLAPLSWWWLRAARRRAA
jgi:integral membrane protein (TIGR01906 family)